MATVDRGLWQRIIEHVVSSGGSIIRPWFTELEPVALEHGLLEIQAPGSAERLYCQQHATPLFTEAAQSATGRLVTVCFLTAAQGQRLEADETVVDIEADAWDGDELLPLSSDYTFDSFVAGPCNRLAHAASMAVTDSLGKVYNPLFLHGSSGLGKTHLVHATCQRVQQLDPSARICFLSCEMFVNHFIRAVEAGQLNDFRYRYRHVDVLAIDDIQFLSDREQTQEEFFHTFNTLYQAQKQIVLSSDRGPGEIPDLEERLVSRFNWGLVARIDRPCYETRMAIVHKKAKWRGLTMPEEVVCLIASTIDSSTRELEGAISKVAMLAQVAERPIDLEIAEQALGADSGPTGGEIRIEDILSAVTGRFNVRLADLQSRKRSRSITFPRQICMFLARKLTRHSLEEIGGYFGGRDHTTVLHANRAIENLAKGNPQLQATLDRLTQDLRQTI